MIETPDKEDEAAFILGLTTAQVKSAAISLGHDSACPSCKKTGWILATSEGKPCILNTPVVTAAGLAMWHFCMQCSYCGLSKFISAGTIADQVKSTEAQAQDVQ